jgi:hypothetical protein
MPAARPRILGATVTPRVLTRGADFRATVRTTTDVVTVNARARGMSIGVPRVGPGLFVLSLKLRPLPSRLHGAFPITFDARDANGAEAQAAVGVSAP